MFNLRISSFLPAVVFCAVALLPSCGDDDTKVEEVTAGFTYEVDTETKGKVVFTNTSKNAKTYAWNFGDGGTSDEENPTHTYKKDSTYTVTLKATNGGQSAEAKEIVSLVPVITLKGEASVSIKIGAEYKDAGATAVDVFDNDLTDKIVVGGTVNTLQPGTYVITYDVEDAQGNKAIQVTRTVTVTFDAGILTNGEFQTEAGWTLNGVAIKKEGENSYLHANVATAGTDSTKINASQQFSGTSHGNIYNLSFNASSDVARAMVVGFQEGPFNVTDPRNIMFKTFDLSTETQRFTYEMTISSEFFIPKENPLRTLFFIMGGKVGSVDVDNVALEFVKKAKFVTELPADFEDGSTFGFSTNSFMVLSNVANPDKTGINPSANVLKVTRLPGPNKSTSNFNNNFSASFKPEDGAVFKLKVWSHAKNARLEFSLEGPNASVATLSQSVSAANAWVELTFDFSKVASFNLTNGYDKIRINPNVNGAPSTAETFYFDDIRQGK